MLAFSAASFALAMAERMHFSTCAAARLRVKRRIASAWFTSLPRIMSTTRRAFCAEPRKYFALAVASILSSSNPFSVNPRSLLRRRCDLARLLDLRTRVAFERARRRKLAELVAHHVFRHEIGRASCRERV